MNHPSLVLIILGATTILSLSMAFLAARASLLTRGSRRQFVSVSLISAAILFFVLTYLVLRFTSPNASEGNHPTPTFQVSVSFLAPSQRSELIHVPFSVGSGSVNVGCDETRSATIYFALPATAKVESAQADWVNTDNLEAQSRDVFIQRDQVAASGRIQGVAKNWIFNCPGGGHGELFLRGTYSIEKQITGPLTVISTIRDVARVGSRFTAKVPSEVLLNSLHCQIQVVGAGNTATLDGVVSQESSGALLFKANKQDGTLPIKPFFELTSMVIQF